VSDENYRKQKAIYIYRREYLRNKVNELERSNKVRNRVQLRAQGRGIQEYQCVLSLINDENTNIDISRLSKKSPYLKKTFSVTKCRLDGFIEVRRTEIQVVDC
jgi:hypothetical protein